MLSIPSIALSSLTATVPNVAGASPSLRNSTCGLVPAHLRILYGDFLQVGVDLSHAARQILPVARREPPPW